MACGAIVVAPWLGVMAAWEVSNVASGAVEEVTGVLEIDDVLVDVEVTKASLDPVDGPSLMLNALTNVGFGEISILILLYAD